MQQWRDSLALEAKQLVTYATLKRGGEMIPAGPERDKVIAELRGECAHEALAKVVDSHDYYDCHKCSKMFLPYKNYIKPYSTGIATSMELWEEMKGAGATLTLECEETWVQVIAVFGNHPTARGAAETEADAISGAWLKWKEES